MISNSESEKDFKEYFGTFNDVFVFCLTIVYFICVIVFPIFGIYKILRNFEILEEPDFFARYEFLISDLDLSSKSKSMYHMIFVVTRVIIALTLIFMRDLP